MTILSTSINDQFKNFMHHEGPLIRSWHRLSDAERVRGASSSRCREAIGGALHAQQCEAAVGLELVNPRGELMMLHGYNWVVDRSYNHL